jgi:8-hydroxy-5-deazaflavin:NADPH oxidoreductase
MRIGIIGNGNVGRALKALFEKAGHDVVIGARAADTAGTVRVPEAVASAEAVVLAVPFAALEDLLDSPLSEALDGRIVIDVTNPVQADWSPVPLGQGGSAALKVSQLAPRARVVKAFNTVFADVMTPNKLDRAGQPVTAFIAGDDQEAVQLVAQLAEQSGLAPVPVGGLDKAWLVEAVAHLNIAIAVGQAGGTNAAFVYHRG